MSEKLLIQKVVSSLPATLDPNTIYLVRVGVGFDLYVSDSLGQIAHKSNSPQSDFTQTNINAPDFIKNKPTTLAGYGITDASPALNTETIIIPTGGANVVVTTPTPYTPGMIIVFVNGVSQAAFTATNGTTITFPFLLDGDEVSIVKFTPFNVANAVPQAGGTIAGNLTVSGKITNDYVIQPGFISLIPNSMTVPTGYLLCDGTTILESAYPNLVGKLPASTTSGQLQLPTPSEVTSGSAVKAIIKV